MEVNHAFQSSLAVKRKNTFVMEQDPHQSASAILSIFDSLSVHIHKKIRYIQGLLASVILHTRPSL